MSHPARRPLAPIAAIAGPVLFTAAWLILGAVSPGFTVFGTLNAPYSAIHHPVSGLGMGVTAPWMNGAFLLLGVLLITGVAGVMRELPGVSRARRWTVGVLLALTGVGAILVGLFDLESFLLHSLGFALACGVPVLSFAVAGGTLRRLPSWRRIGNALLVAGPLTLALLIAFFASFDYREAAAGRGVAGLVQRVLITEVLLGFALLGWHARDSTGREHAETTAARPLV